MSTPFDLEAASAAALDAQMEIDDRLDRAQEAEVYVLEV
jgi:hypothetical protein